MYINPCYFEMFFRGMKDFIGVYLRGGKKMLSVLNCVYRKYGLVINKGRVVRIICIPKNDRYYKSFII